MKGRWKRLMATNKKGGRLFYLYMHMIKTEVEGKKSKLGGRDKGSWSTNKRKQSTWQTERDLRRSTGQGLRVHNLKVFAHVLIRCIQLACVRFMNHALRLVISVHGVQWYILQYSMLDFCVSLWLDWKMKT